MSRVLIRRVPVRRTRIPIQKSQQSGIKLLDNQILRKFNPSILDLGDISTPAQEIEAIAAVFDLAGFTKFCNQVDSYLAIPRFLSDFLDWFFRRVKKGLTKENQEFVVLFGQTCPSW